MENYLTTAVVLILISIIYLKLAEHFNIIDNPNNRSSHTISTIRGGGVLFIAALWIFFYSSDFQYPYLVLGVTLISGISFIDDIKTLSSKMRLPFQFIAVFLVLFQVGLPFSPSYIFIIAMIIGVGFVNLYNFMDGVNGITAAYSLGVLFGLYLVNGETHTINPDLIVYLCISIIVFGYYNFRNKARFFAGDIGSISMAVIVFFMIFSFVHRFFAPVFILWVAVYSVDACLTIGYRKIIGEKIMEAHRLHIYQKIVDTYKTPHLVVSFSYALLQFLIGWLVFKTYKLPLLLQVEIVCLVLLLLTALYVFLFYKTKQKKIS
tara:strand:+ start:1011 stop:1970 length:960 start_codon:yes stop_codon:yes gene_type:complete